MSKNNEYFFIAKKSWSVIKDSLLERYLEPYFSKILGTQKPVFYVDAFAGKGKFDDGNPGSPIIALEKISKALEITHFKRPSIEACFIELNHFDDLEKNLKNYKNFFIVKGSYEKNIEQQLIGKQFQNVFVYIDPYGIKSLYFSIFEKISNMELNSIEMLVNFNSFGFIREACNAMGVNFDVEDLDDLLEIEVRSKDSKQKSINDLNEVAGGDYWQEIIEDKRSGKINGYDAEKQFSERYCEKLRSQFDYVLNMPIRLNKGQRPKYRMIHATNHAQGCVLMNDNMCKCWEALQDIQNRKQGNFFGEDVENESFNRDKVRKEIIDFLAQFKDYVEIDIFYARFVSKYGVRLFSREIRNELIQLWDTHKLEVSRSPEFTDKGKLSNFWTTDKKHIVKIRYAK